MAKIYVAVTVPPGCMSGIKVEWDNNLSRLRSKCQAAKKCDDRLRIEIFDVNIDEKESGEIK